MTSVFRQGVSLPTLLQLVAEFSWLVIAGIAALVFLAHVPSPSPSDVAHWFMFALVVVSLNIGFGVYQSHVAPSRGLYVIRALLAVSIATLLAYFIAKVIPGGTAFEENLATGALFTLSGLFILRHFVVLPLIGTVRPHRVLVLGTGPEARLVEASLAAADPTVHLVGFFALDKVEETAVAPQQIIAKTRPLEETVRQLGIREIIVAVRQQRGGVLPLRALLDCRLNGVQITDLPRFFERVLGRVPLESLKVSWLIYGSGYRQGWLRSFVKRVFDLSVALALLLLTLPLMLACALLIALESDGPVIYRQERVGRRGSRFTVLKFRSMALDAEKDGKAEWAAADDARVTRVGRFMRRARIDELPQLINVLKGEMSFVGPRPERPEFIEMLTQQIPFYAVRHSVKPGLTGWAQVRYSYGATVEQAVKKLEYDLYYVKNHTLLLDILILLETVRVVLLGEGAH